MTAPKTLSLAKAAEAFAVTTMTIHTWRKRTSDPLPAEVSQVGRVNRVSVPLTAAREWAKRNGKKFDTNRFAVKPENVAKPAAAAPTPAAKKSAEKGRKKA